MSTIRKLVIAIDGPAGSGKTTIAARLARKLGYINLESGAMYRALALKAMEQQTPLDDGEALRKLAENTAIDLQPRGEGNRVLLDGRDVSQRVRQADVTFAASQVSGHPAVRRLMVTRQRALGKDGGVVMEGRDIGSVVFPDAGLKIFLTASPEIRAERRWREHQQKGDSIDLARTLEEIHERDRRDRERSASPLVRAADAVIVDSTAMEPEEVARLVVMLARGQTVGRAK